MGGLIKGLLYCTVVPQVVQTLLRNAPLNANLEYFNILLKAVAPHLGRGPLVGVLPGLEGSNPQSGELALEDGHAAPRGGQQLEGGLQRRAQGTLGLHGLAEHLGQALQQILDQLGRETHTHTHAR